MMKNGWQSQELFMAVFLWEETLQLTRELHWFFLSTSSDQKDIWGFVRGFGGLEGFMGTYRI